MKNLLVKRNTRAGGKSIKAGTKLTVGKDISAQNARELVWAKKAVDADEAAEAEKEAKAAAKEAAKK